MSVPGEKAPILVLALAVEVYQDLRRSDAQALQAHLDTTYARDWEARGLSVYQYQALGTYAMDRLSCLTHRARGAHRLALIYQRQAAAQARTLNRWVADTQAHPTPAQGA